MSYTRDPNTGSIRFYRRLSSSCDQQTTSTFLRMQYGVYFKMDTLPTKYYCHMQYSLKIWIFWNLAKYKMYLDTSSTSRRFREVLYPLYMIATSILPTTHPSGTTLRSTRAITTVTASSFAPTKSSVYTEYDTERKDFCFANQRRSSRRRRNTETILRFFFF